MQSFVSAEGTVFGEAPWVGVPVSVGVTDTAAAVVATYEILARDKPPAWTHQFVAAIPRHRQEEVWTAAKALHARSLQHVLAEAYASRLIVDEVALAYAKQYTSIQYVKCVGGNSNSLAPGTTFEQACRRLILLARQNPHFPGIHHPMMIQTFTNR